eukprot:TRINITY_DN55727_c0_g1_i1.p1 TRINITY_DN55727_c0_g1~~TRINITY_DN55727_c0_g1_i1.p1  ORF type:complete len:547 (-),score=22.30 TRINITY_DN55727_c0_g1_i1:33-1673(-)
MLLRCAVVLILCSICSSINKPPHILWILADDYGWADVGYHRIPGTTPHREIQTPNIDSLASDGLELDRMYVYKTCTPTRSALQSGRNPIHVNVLLIERDFRNPLDLDSGYQGIPRNMTGIAEVMKRGGYKTHMVGKWDCGMATPQHTPQGRGYDDSFFYFTHSNNYWNQTALRKPDCFGTPVTDMWLTQGQNISVPAKYWNNSWECSQNNQRAGCVYEEQRFLDRAKMIIEKHDTTHPMFLFYAFHIAHTPLEVPQAYVDRFSFIADHSRRMYHAMVNWMDDAIGDIVTLLKKVGMYDSTLIVFSSDNGGPIYEGGAPGANNYPLKGGKASNWEGGIRVNAFVSGGYLPKQRRGMKEEGLITGWDWYKTFAHLAGQDPTDHRAAAAGLPPIDGYNMWPMLSQLNVSSPRNEIPIGDAKNQWASSPTLVGGLISGRHKLLVGAVPMAVYTGPDWPNVTSHLQPGAPQHTVHCGRTPATGCLYNIFDDPLEENNLAPHMPTLWHTMYARVLELQKGVFSPNRGKVDPAACHAALNKYGGFWGPWVDVP